MAIGAWWEEGRQVNRGTTHSKFSGFDSLVLKTHTTCFTRFLIHLYSYLLTYFNLPLYPPKYYPQQYSKLNEIPSPANPSQPKDFRRYPPNSQSATWVIWLSSFSGAPYDSLVGMDTSLMHFMLSISTNFSLLFFSFPNSLTLSSLGFSLSEIYLSSPVLGIGAPPRWTPHLWQE